MTILLEGSAARRTGQSSVVYKLAADEGSATSNACERLFAQTGLILTPQRGRLANANFEALTFLRANLVTITPVIDLPYNKTRYLLITAGYNIASRGSICYRLKHHMYHHSERRWYMTLAWHLDLVLLMPG
ncbi:hypothetical protein F443_12267 [Phytophthora nicotianae P1569]|uniref:Uncharacterized protein n=1 Tax=Phytophthora nicotianae P1569 TaxID=1317065 RepID=V9EWZ7_PHYNI|nr:hypothetical protein F443_12267 [Phytophthora nicotianae P1569]